MNLIVKRNERCNAHGMGLRCERRKGHSGNHMASPKKDRTTVKEWEAS